jgi:hypothetical protein
MSLSLDKYTAQNEKGLAPKNGNAPSNCPCDEK